jgi:hypothetical protein
VLDWGVAVPVRWPAINTEIDSRKDLKIVPENGQEKILRITKKFSARDTVDRSDLKISGQTVRPATSESLAKGASTRSNSICYNSDDRTSFSHATSTSWLWPLNGSQDL